MPLPAASYQAAQQCPSLSMWIYSLTVKVFATDVLWGYSNIAISRCYKSLCDTAVLLKLLL